MPVSKNDFPTLFEEGGRSFSSAIFWTPDQQHVVRSHMTSFSSDKDTFQVWKPADFNPVSFAAHLAQTKNHSCLFSISLAASTIFFKALFAGTDDVNIHFQLPEKIFKVQRRKFPRFQIPMGYVLKIHFETPFNEGKVTTQKVWDLSAGGLSFCVNSEEQGLFDPGQLLKEMKFVLQTKTICVEAEIRHKALIQDGPKKGQYKIGVLFKTISKSDIQLITDHVSEESRKYYSRFI